MKREYVKPMAIGQVFETNEYVAACYKGKCDISGTVYSDANGNGKIDSGEREIYSNSACGSVYEITGQNSVLPPKNAVVRNTEWVWDFWPIVGHEEYTDTPVWYFGGNHVTTTMVQDTKRPNHS